jgi:hypothetical protein
LKGLKESFFNDFVFFLILCQQSALQNLESLFPRQPDGAVDSSANVGALAKLPEVASIGKTLGERTTLFKITCSAMINSCKEYADLANAQGRKWQRLLQHERDQRLRLEEMVETLARQHSHLEQSVVQEHRDAKNKPAKAAKAHGDNVIGVVGRTAGGGKTDLGVNGSNDSGELVTCGPHAAGPPVTSMALIFRNVWVGLWGSKSFIPHM